MSFRKENIFWDPSPDDVIDEAIEAAVVAFRKTLDQNRHWSRYLPYSGDKATEWTNTPYDN